MSCPARGTKSGPANVMMGSNRKVDVPGENTMEMTYAKALNEAKQIIIQQQLRIKSDAEKIKQQQQTIVDQSHSIGEWERKMNGSTDELQRIVEELKQTHGKLHQTTTSLEQSEAVVNRQGEKINAMQQTIRELEQRVGEQAAEIAQLRSERDQLQSQLPTRDDIEALSAMSELLSRRPSRAPVAQMRLVDSEQAAPQSEAA